MKRANVPGARDWFRLYLSRRHTHKASLSHPAWNNEGLVKLFRLFKELEKVVDAGLVKSIGLSNFTRPLLDHIIKKCTIKPVLLHMETTILHADEELLAYAQSFGIQVSLHDVAAPPTSR